MESELEKLREEKDKLLETQKVNTEKKKLEREIFILKNPLFAFVWRVIKGTFTVAANVGDAIMRSATNFLSKRPNTAAKQPPVSQPKQTKSTKGNPEPPKPTGILDSMSTTMANIDKEMKKFDNF